MSFFSQVSKVANVRENSGERVDNRVWANLTWGTKKDKDGNLSGSGFKFSKAFMSQAGIAYDKGNRAISYAPAGDTVYILTLVGEGLSCNDPKSKSNNKSQTFTSNILEGYLAEAGLIPTEKAIGQKVKFSLVEDAENLEAARQQFPTIEKLYKVELDTTSSDEDEDEDEAVAPFEEVVEAPVAETPVAEASDDFM
jgi:hypothetical protein